MINTEDEAAMALQVSNALTQALLQYRLKNVSQEVSIYSTTGFECSDPGIATVQAEKCFPRGEYIQYIQHYRFPML